MASYRHTIGSTQYVYANLSRLLSCASSPRSGDDLAGISARDQRERVAARYALADLPLRTFLEEPLVPYEEDEVTRLILDEHNDQAFARVAALTVGELRDWLLSEQTDSSALAAIASGLTPEMAAAVSKLMTVLDLVTVAARCRVVTRFRTTLGLSGRLASRLQANSSTDDPAAVLAGIVDGLMFGAGDAMIGINPATDNLDACVRLLEMLDELRTFYEAPVQSCVLSHVTTTLRAIERGAPVDLVFQSIAGSEKANAGFGLNLSLLAEAEDAARSMARAPEGGQIMYFETGQGSALSADGHHGLDQQTMESRAYAVARKFNPFLVNTVVGFIGPEYLYDSKQIIRAGLEDHFCAKLLGVPMGADVCYTNHAEADQDDMDNLALLLCLGGVNFLIAVPGGDDVMLSYQSLAFHDIAALRQTLRLRPAPEFELWLAKMQLTDPGGRLLTSGTPSVRLLS